MGLGDNFEATRNQILIMDQLPSVAKAYSMVVEVENRRSLQGLALETSDNDVMQTRTYQENPGNGNASGYRRRKDKTHLKCFHYGKWLRLKTGGNSGKPRIGSVNNVKYQETPLECNGADVNFNDFIEFAGNISSELSINAFYSDNGSWIIDSGASVHVYGDAKFSSSINNMFMPTILKLSDNSVKTVNAFGNVKFQNNFILYDCLYLPSFKYNLMSVSRITKSANIHVIFFPVFCAL
ncbi:hypothetical protein LIER_04663 [Lithospermum erythrorhizon]|uniref:Retrovirus-related Pol polyprotein from transposon TNT 1-94-like beta-barrel domain-containing protein n=1 Tax=Lithospermum erythrorhizon TaxID=34254 RepID=A0AAV3NXI6_LITER